MISRIRLLITAAFVCHLLLAPRLVTSQLQSQPQLQCPSPAASAIKGEGADICAVQQEKDGPIWKLHQRGRIAYRSLLLWADEASYNTDTGDVTVEGHVVLEGGPNDEHIEASRGTYNVETDTGTFYHVAGRIGAGQRQRHLLLTSTSPFTFTGKVVEKTGPDHYIVYDGTVTSCELPHPKWMFTVHRAVVDVSGSASIYSSTFRIRGVPVLYFPFATHPVERTRQSGLLVPNFGRSTIKGFILGESFFWAINRSTDVRVGGEYFSKRGWAQNGEFRMRPSETSFVDLTYFGVIDRGFQGSPTSGPCASAIDQTTGECLVKQGGEDIRLNAEGRFGRNFRAVANVDYLSSFVFRLAFNEVFTQAVYSEVKSQGFLSNTTRGFSYNASVQRYQNFESTQNGDVITILHAPSFEFSSVDRKLGDSPLYWSLDAAAEGLSRREPSFRTAPLLGRFNLSPSLSLPLLFHGWSLRPEVTVDDTFYTQRLIPPSEPGSGVGAVANDAINRRALETAVELRPPPLERVFNREIFGRKFKHVIEPRVVYRRVIGMNNFSDILRFDSRDILSDTNEVEYGIVSRLFSKRTSSTPEDCSPSSMHALFGGSSSSQNVPTWARDAEEPPPSTCAPTTRELVRWEVAQKYFLDPTFGGALVNVPPPNVFTNVFTTSADFTAIAFLTSPRHLSPLISRLRIQPTAKFDAEWDLDYDFKGGRINSSTALLSYRIGQITIGGSDAYLQAPGETIVSNGVASPARFHQFRLLMGYGGPSKRGFSGAVNVGFDANLGFLQYAAVQSTYNWDCCGINLEYRRFALGSVRNENQYRFTFSLANIGGFGNLRRQERLY